MLGVDTSRSPAQITIERGEHALLPGRYSLLFDSDEGHARLGEVLSETHASVTRELLAVDRGSLRAGAAGRITGWWYTDPRELADRVEDVLVPMQLGETPAWKIAPEYADGHVWAIHVHGRGARREETLRGVAPALRAGMTSLVISYRNDPEAPTVSRGRYGLGSTEWRDVAAAMEWAVQQGAEKLVLFGWSMGGTATLLAAERSVAAERIAALVLDSPAVSWPNLIDAQAAGYHLPRAVRAVANEMLRSGNRATGLQEPIPIPEMQERRFAQSLRVPVLIHSSLGDTFVPCGPARRFAELRPDLVELHEASIGEHVKIWNVEPEEWERPIDVFLRNLPRTEGKRPGTVDADVS